MNVILYAVAGAILAGLAAGLVFLLSRPLNLSAKARQVATSVAVVLSIGLLRVLPVQDLASAMSGQPTNEADRALLQYPAFAAIKKHYPEDYEQIRSRLTAGMAAGDTDQEIILAARPIVLSVFLRQVAKASDERIEELLAITNEQGARLRALNPKYCHELLNTPAVISFNPSALLPSELTRRELNLMAAILNETAGQPDQPVAAISESRITSLAEAAFGDLSQDGKDALERIDFNMASANDASEYQAGCDFTLGMLRGIQSGNNPAEEFRAISAMPPGT